MHNKVQLSTTANYDLKTDLLTFLNAEIAAKLLSWITLDGVIVPNEVGG